MVVDTGPIARFLGATDEELGLIEEPTFHVYIRNRQFERQGEVKEWKSLTFVDRFNNIGTWQMEFDPNSDTAQLMTKNSGIIITMIYGDTETTIFSGTVSTEYSKSANSIRVGGRSDAELLEIPARPTPSQNTGPFADEYDVRTGIAATVFRNAVSANIGPTAPSMWKLNQLNVPAGDAVGSTITWRGRFDPLLTLLRQYSLIDGLGFSLRQSNVENNDIDFIVYEPEDKSASVKFSIELNTAQDYNDQYTMPVANYVYVLGGDDFGLDRTIVEAGDAASIAELGRIIPVIIDRRGITDLSELNQAAAEFLAGVISTRRATVTPFNLPSMRYVINYNLGDLVTIVSSEGEFIDIIREVEVNLDPQRGAIIVPMIGQAGTSEDDAVATHIAAVQDRIGNIERNWRVPDDSIIEDMLHPTMKWNPGDIKITARSTAQPGWLFCDGSSLLASVYSRLFNAIGTTFGSGSGPGEFNIPNCDDKFIVGAGLVFSLGDSGGSPTIGLIDHSHTHSHGMNNHTHNPGAHTHPLSHSHGLRRHHHYYDMDHDHDGSGAEGTFVTQGPVAALFGDGIVHFDEGDGDEQSAADSTHVHRVHITNYNVPPQATTHGYIVSDDVEFDTTQDDNNVGAAVFTTSGSGPLPNNSTESDDQMVDEQYLEETIDNYPPCVAMNVMIYTGVIV